MEFKDRVANKPNRVKLTYEDSGVSSFAVVELADEPIEEGTPLNAQNMNKLLNKENDIYVVEWGKKDGWDYKIYSDGFKIFSYVHTLPTDPNDDTIGNLYFSEDRMDAGFYYSVGIDFDAYPFPFINLPSTHIDYISADYTADDDYTNDYNSACFVLKGFGKSPASSVVNGTRIRPPHIWLYKGNTDPVGHPVFKVTAWGY